MCLVLLVSVYLNLIHTIFHQRLRLFRIPTNIFKQRCDVLSLLKIKDLSCIILIVTTSLIHFKLFVSPLSTASCCQCSAPPNSSNMDAIKTPGQFVSLRFQWVGELYDYRLCCEFLGQHICVSGAASPHINPAKCYSQSEGAVIVFTIRFDCLRHFSDMMKTLFSTCPKNNKTMFI